MKKAKLMLSAIAVVAVVGGALAFNAMKPPITIFTGVQGSGKCQTQTSGVLDAGTTKVAASTTSLASGCPDRFTTDTE